MGHYQLFESQAADKLAAVVLNATTTRWKDFVDLSMLWKMRLDARIVAAELMHKLRRTLPTPCQVIAALPPLSETLSIEYIEELGAVWKACQAKHGKQVSADFVDVACDARQFYFAVRDAMDASLRQRQPRAKRLTAAELQAAYIKLRKEKDAAAKVVQLGHYRIDGAEPAPSYRPKGF